MLNQTVGIQNLQEYEDIIRRTVFYRPGEVYSMDWAHRIGHACTPGSSCQVIGAGCNKGVLAIPIPKGWTGPLPQELINFLMERHYGTSNFDVLFGDDKKDTPPF